MYDRRHGGAVANDELRLLWESASLPERGRVLDLGAGTGRLAIPLAETRRQCTVVAVEPARGMLDQLRSKNHGQLVQVVAGEGAFLPFASNSFDVIMIARLLYLTADWKAILLECHRVLTAGGSLLHQWGNGDTDESWVQIREEARQLFERTGVESPFHPGARSESIIGHNLAMLGFIPVASIPTGTGPETTLRQFFQRLVAGELSYIWNVPDNVRSKTLPVLEAWVQQHFDLDQPTPMPRDLRWTVHRKPA